MRILHALLTRVVPALLAAAASSAAAAERAGPALEDPRSVFLARQLASALDARARAQAALTLGATEAPGARPPLCAALADSVPLVRSAAARALVALHDVEALDCLAGHGADEDGQVASEIERSVTLLRQVRARTPRVAVWVDGVRDTATPPLGGRVATDARERMVRRLAWAGARSGVLERAGAVPKGLPAFLLKPELDRTDTGVVLVAVCLTWPGKQILGEVRVRASGAAPGDLVAALVPRLLQDAARTFDWNLDL